MPRIELTSHLARHVTCPPEDVSDRATTVREALEQYFARHPGVREYVLDEQGKLRRHVVVFVGGVQARDRERLSDAVAPDQTVYIMQALSGG